MTESGTCVRCGETTDVRLGPVFICQACYEVRSSCCPEFGPDDLTDPHPDQEEATKDGRKAGDGREDASR